VSISIRGVDAHTVDDLVTVPCDDVEMVEYDLRLWTLIGDLIDVGAAHIEGNRFNIPPMFTQKLEERAYRDA
jgi:hypothetical protein